MNNTTSDNTQEQPSMIADIKKRLSDAKTNLSSIKKVICDPATKSLIVGDIKNILNDFNTKLIFIFVSLFVLCNTFITNLIDKYIDRGILSGFNDNIAERILFIVVIALLIYYSRIAIRRNKKVSNAEIEWAVIILLFWAYYRLISIGWTYVKFWNLDFIYYIDIVLLLSLSIFARRLLYKHLEYKPVGSNGFELDLPITEEDEHSLKRDDLAQKLATKIKNTNVKESAFSIGIESPWGFGKTSFINLLCNHLTDKNTIIIKFNPWNYDKERSLVDAFFVELRETLKIYDSSLSTTLTQYGNILSHSNHDTIKLSAEFIQCFSSQSFKIKRDKVDAAIKSIGKLIVVVIDDLDRLDKDEIISVLKLIRNSANFPNMVFVSAYDKEYLVETLKEDICNSNKYLEKIFQYQFKLPEYDKSKLQELLSKNGEIFIEGSDKNEFQTVLNDDYLKPSGNGILLNNIDNIRDVYRFLNSFKFVYQSLKGEIVIKDLMYIELLRMKYYDVYELLSKEHEKYLVSPNNYLILWNPSHKESSNSIVEHEDIMDVITEKYTKGGKEFRQINRMLKSMFGIGNVTQVPKAINNPFYIDRYFYYSLFDSDVPEEEFKSAMEDSYDQIKQKIDGWVENNQSTSLSLNLEKFKINTVDEYQKIIRIIFYFGSKIDLWPISFDYIQDIIKNLTMENKKEFIRGVFFENGNSKFVVKYIQYLLNNSVLKWDYIFTFEECLIISAEMFKKVCKDNENIKIIVQFLLYTHYDVDIQNDDFNGSHSVEKHNEKADSMFFEYMKSSYSKFLTFLICDKNKTIFSLKSSVFRIWKNKDAFIGFINELFESNNDDKQLQEFVEFMNKYLSQESLAPIPFDFKYIKLDS